MAIVVTISGSGNGSDGESGCDDGWPGRQCDMMMRRNMRVKIHNVTGAGVTRVFSVGGRTSTSGAVALSRTLVSSWWAYFHRGGGHIIFLSLMDISSFWSA